MMEQALTLPKFKAPITAFDFDKAYTQLFTFWSDSRIPVELKTLLATDHPKTALEMGCGLGRFTNYLAQKGVRATGVDFSQVAIGKAKKKNKAQDDNATFLVGDVTDLHQLAAPFDMALDVGCFHWLDAEGQEKYIAEAYRLLKPGATLLLWAMDSAPSGEQLNPENIKAKFKGFRIQKSEFSRRRLVASHWYWLERDGNTTSALKIIQ